jgi:hypothetical protein
MLPRYNGGTIFHFVILSVAKNLVLHRSVALFSSTIAAYQLVAGAKTRKVALGC